MNDAVRPCQIGGQNSSSIHFNRFAFCRNVQGLTRQRLDRVQFGHIGGGQASLNNVIEQHIGQGLRVSKPIFNRACG